ncbi:MAG: hypothetical protein M1828_005698 [Chrysothrix sp. TS-e1954]|nr:MAG: hypothetical protein M1828_005698 [Chrysothrix sp. TS-e1954]
MPSRVATSTTRSRPRPSSPVTLNEGPSTTLRERICAVFSDVQRSNTGHRKLVVSLRKTQESCCFEPTKPSKKRQDDVEFDEAQFNGEVTRCALRILPVKKSEPVGDRIVKFLGMFLKHATALDSAIFQEGNADETQGFVETPSSRLASQVISQCLPLLQAKDKVVRFRCTQIIASLINTLDYVDDELFDYIRLGLIKRLRDKESNVRVQAVYGLGRLAGQLEAEDDGEDSDDDTAGGLLEKLLDLLQNDPSAEVRRSLLLNLPLTQSTLPFLLERARDLDVSLRRALYGRLLPALGDFRHLSLTHREKILRWGLRDRDETVQKATARLFSERWIEDCARVADAEPPETKSIQAAEPSSEGLLELLERIDVANSGHDGGIALDAMKEFWNSRPDYRSFMNFDEAFWNDLSAESVFVARTFNDFCHQDGASELLQEKMPEVTRFAFLIQSNVNTLVKLVQDLATQENDESDSEQQEFIVEQLLAMALTLDYSDEVGRRTMFSLMREALAIADLPEEATRLVIDVLRATCGTNSTSERDFCGVVLEAIAEVHDTIMGEEPQKNHEDPDESFHSARSEQSGDSTPKQRQAKEDVDPDKAIREIMVNMKCLHIAQCMLQNVECNLESNVDLVTMLNTLVVPAVRSQEAPIRERGLLCLGLCCLLDKNLAEENITLFLHCYNKGHEQLQMIAVQIIGDILAAHPSLLTTRSTPSPEGTDSPEHPLQKPIHKLFSKSLKSSSPSVQSSACATLCKLMLSAPSATTDGNVSVLNADELLKLLVMSYFDPDTVGNLSLRQSLSYCLPVYCHSRRENMERMGRIALNIVHWCIGMKEEMDVDGDEEAGSEIVGINVVTAHLIDWTDSRKLVMAKRGFGAEPEEADGHVHLQLADDILEKVLGVCTREERKTHIAMLGKLYITPNSDPEMLKNVNRLVAEAIDDKVAADAVTRNSLTKLQAALAKCMETHTSVPASSRPASRDKSSGGDIDDAETVAGEGDDDVDMQSTLTTPAASPRKQKSRRTTTATSLSDQTVLTTATTPAASPRKKSRKMAAPEPPTMFAPPEDLDPALTATSPNRSPRKRTLPQRAKRNTTAMTEASSSPLADAVDNEDDSHDDTVNEILMADEVASPTPAPKSQADDDKENDEPDLSLLSLVDKASNPQSKVKEEKTEARSDAMPQSKRGGRGGRGAGRGGARGGPPRRSVRAGRRKADGEVEIDD